jgi:hypothetical protein
MRLLAALLALALISCGHGKSIEGDADAVETHEPIAEPVLDPDVHDPSPEPAPDPLPEPVPDVPEEDGPCTGPPSCPGSPIMWGVPGGPCTSDTDCPGGSCMEEEIVWHEGSPHHVEWPGGTCVVWGCSPDDPTTCPSGGRCIFVGEAGGSDYFACLAACRPLDTTWTPYDWNCGCREGYRCDIEKEVCLPGCSGDHECCELWSEAGELLVDTDCTSWCDGDDADEYPATDCMARFSCINEGDPSATWLSPCLFDSDCPPDAFCLNEIWHTDPLSGEPLYPGGLCRKHACHLIGRGCGLFSDLHGDCVNLGTTSDPDYDCTPTCETACVEPGSTANPCHHPGRTHPYACRPLDPTRWFPASTRDGLCLPATIPAAAPGNDMYSACTQDSDCASPHGLGRCLVLMDKPGFCSADCNQNLAETCTLCGAAPSPGDVPPGVCALGLCLPSCDTVRGRVGDNGCPTGAGLPDFACYPGDGSYGGAPYKDPSSLMPAGMCIPACTSTADCGLLWAGVVSCVTTSGVCG